MPLCKTAQAETYEGVISWFNAIDEDVRRRDGLRQVRGGGANLLADVLCSVPERLRAWASGYRARGTTRYELVAEQGSRGTCDGSGLEEG